MRCSVGMQRLLLAWMGVTLIAIAVCCYYLATSRADSDTVAQSAPALPSKLVATIDTVATAGDSGPRVQVNLVPSEHARLVEMVEADEKQIATEAGALMQRRNFEREVVRKYQFIFDAMPSLSAEKRKQLRMLLAERELQMYDSAAAIAKLGIQPGSPEYQAAYDRLAKDMETRLAAASDSDYPEFSRLRGLAAQMFAIDLTIAPSAEFIGAPLSADQKLRLATLMRELNVGSGTAAVLAELEQPVDPVSGLLPAYQNLISQASAFLTPQQLAAIKAGQDQSIAARKRVLGYRSQSKP